MSNLVTGKSGEYLAADWLKARGYTLLEQNYRSKQWGELDLICLEGGDLVFVEVKTRIGSKYGQAIEAVSFGKRQRLLRAAQYYKMTHADTPASLRFDVVTISQADSLQSPQIGLYKNIDHG